MAERRLARLGVVSFICAAACTSSHSPAIPPISTIHLAQCPWDASRIDAAIARIILEEHMGYAVDITEIDEFAQWEPIATGTLHASLEVWPSGHHADIARYVDTNQVEDGGPLGPVGKIGWYIPSYLLTQHPELASWRGFLSPEMVDLFKTPATDPQGQFLSGNPTWTQYDADIIANLGLNFKVVYAGTEKAELDELASVYARRAPILMYMWTPHSALSKYDMTAVELPAYSDACYATAATHGINCDYPPDQLFKIFWPSLQAAAPAAYHLLKSFHYTTKDQVTLLQRVNNDGLSIDAAARTWIDANTAVWQTWIEQ